MCHADLMDGKLPKRKCSAGRSSCLSRSPGYQSLENIREV